MIQQRPPWYKEKWWQQLKPKDILPWWQQFKLQKGKPTVAKLCPACGAIKLRKVIERGSSTFQVYFECTECKARFILTGKGLIRKKTYRDGRFKSQHLGSVIKE